MRKTILVDFLLVTIFCFCSVTTEEMSSEKEIFRPSRRISGSIAFSSVHEPFDLNNGLESVGSSNILFKRQPRAMQQQQQQQRNEPEEIRTGESDFPYPFWRPKARSIYFPKAESSTPKKNYNYYMGKSNTNTKSSWAAPLVNIPHDLISEANLMSTKGVPKDQEDDDSPPSSTPNYGRQASGIGNSNLSRRVKYNNRMVYWNSPVKEKRRVVNNDSGRPRFGGNRRQRPPTLYGSKEKSDEIRIIGIHKNKPRPHSFYPVKKSPNLKMHILQNSKNETSYKPVYPYINLSTKRLISVTTNTPSIAANNIGISTVPKEPTSKYNFLDYSRYTQKNIIEGSTQIRKNHNENIVDRINQKTKFRPGIKEDHREEQSSKITFPGPVTDRYDELTSVTYKPTRIQKNKQTFRHHPRVASTGPEYSYNNVPYRKTMERHRVSGPNAESWPVPVRPGPGPSYYEIPSTSKEKHNSNMGGLEIVTSSYGSFEELIDDKTKYNMYKPKGNYRLNEIKAYKTKPKTQVSSYNNRPRLNPYTNRHKYKGGGSGRPQQYKYKYRQRPPVSSSYLNNKRPPTYGPSQSTTNPSSMFSFMDILRRPTFRRDPPPATTHTMNDINHQTHRPNPNFYHKPTVSKKYEPKRPYRGQQSDSHNTLYANNYQQDNGILAKLRRIWDRGFLHKPKTAPNLYQDDIPNDQTLMERIASIQSSPAGAMLVPGSLTALGLGLAYYYFNYVWYPTPVVTARLSKLLLSFTTDNQLFDQRDKTSLEKMVRVLSGLESNYFTELMNSDSCRERLVCQLHHDVPNLWDVTRLIYPFISFQLDTTSTDAKAFRNYLSTAQMGHSGVKSCEKTFHSCPLPFISLRPFLNLIFNTSNDDDESNYGQSRVLN